MTRYTYPVDLTEDEDGRVLAVFPDLAGTATDGADRAEALAEAGDCLDEALAGLIERRQEIPAATAARGRPTVNAGVLMTAKAALYSAMVAGGVNNSELGRRLGCGENEVRRMISPRHATKIARIEQGLRALGKQAVLEIRDAA